MQPILSVGLITKNEEKNIADCLDSINRLAKSVPLEIIVVDTGSSDLTKKIISKYDAELFDYNWEGDFAAARNYGLEKCTGKWFLYLDADERLDADISGLSEFLLDDKNKFNSARFIFKNYADERHEVYTESHNLRLCKLDDSHIRFVGKIHEALPELAPCKQLETVIHHIGYITGDSLTAKHKRNMEELKVAYSENPKSSRTLAHLFYSCDTDEKERYLNEWYALLHDGCRDLYSVPVYVAIIETLLNGGCYDDALYYVDEYFDKYFDEKKITGMSVFALTVCILSVQNRTKEMLEFFENYKFMYESFKKNEINTEELNTCVVFFGSSETDYIGLLLTAVSGYLSMGDKMAAKSLISSVNEASVPSMLKKQFNSLKAETFAL